MTCCMGLYSIVKAKNQVKFYCFRPTFDLSDSCFKNNDDLAHQIVLKSEMTWLHILMQF